MSGRAATPDSRFQFTLSQFFVWVTVLCVHCAFAVGWINYLRHVEAKNGSIPPAAVAPTLLFGFLILLTLVGLIFGPPFCYLLALFRSRHCDEGGDNERTRDPVNR